jgi:hypothetical protein
MALPDITTRPLVAKCYIYQSGDSISPFGGTGDAGGQFALANVLDPNTQLRGRTTTGVTNDGYNVFLGSTLPNAVCVELVNYAGSALPAGATVHIRANPGAATFNTGAAWQVLPSDIYTAQQFMSDTLVRPNAIAGYDTLTTPAKTTPPSIASFSVDSFRIETTEATDIGYVETGFFAIGYDARIISEVTGRGLPQGQMRVDSVDLLNAPGAGYRWTINWQYLVAEDLAYLRELWKQTAEGAYPAFLFPAAGIKTSTGELSETWNAPEQRGGLVRLRSLTANNLNALGVRWEHSGVTLTAETWQEVPAP